MLGLRTAQLFFVNLAQLLKLNHHYLLQITFMNSMGESSDLSLNVVVSTYVLIVVSLLSLVIYDLFIKLFFS